MSRNRRGQNVVVDFVTTAVVAFGRHLGGPDKFGPSFFPGTQSAAIESEA